jgi:hypothetical protein
MSTPQLPPQQSAIDRKLVDQLFEIVPEDWNAFIMGVEPRKDLDGGGFVIRILNPDVDDAEIEPTDAIRASVAELAAFFEKDGRAWERLIYAAYVDPTGAWHLKITAPLPDAPAAS